MVFCELIDFSDNILSPFFQVVGDHLVIDPQFGHLISGFFSRSEILMSIALPRLLHLIGNLTSPKRFDSTVNVIGGGNIFWRSNLLFAQLFWFRILSRLISLGAGTKRFSVPQTVSNGS